MATTEGGEKTMDNSLDLATFLQGAMKNNDSGN